MPAHLTQTARPYRRYVSASDYDRSRIPGPDYDEPEDPAALEARRRDSQDQVDLYHSILLGAAFVGIILAWAGGLHWIGDHLRAWVAR